MPAQKPSKLTEQAGLEDLYPRISQAYQAQYGKPVVAPDVWSFFHELHLLQSAREESEVSDIVWALWVFATAARNLDAKRSIEIAKMFITALPSKEHEAWFTLCERDGRVDGILATHLDPNSISRNRSRAVKTAAVIAIILSDFLLRWGELLSWQRDFMSKEVGYECSTLFKEAQDIVYVMSPHSFAFLFARHLMRAGSHALALKLLRHSPSERLMDIVQYGDPPESHSYFELYTRFNLQGGVEAAGAFLDHLIKAEAYSDEALAVFFANEELKDVVFFIIDFVSRVRQSSSGKSKGGRAFSPSGSPNQRRRCCPLLFGKKTPQQQHYRPSMLLRASNIAHVLLWELLQKYDAQDPSGRELLLRDRQFQQAIEVVLLLYDNDLVVRGVERLSDEHQACLRTALRDWSRLHLLRILDQNRPPRYEGDSLSVQSLVKKQELWTWTTSEKRAHYFKSDMRNSQDIALVLWIFFEVGMFLDPAIVKHFLEDARNRSPPIDVLESFFPSDGQLFHAVAGGISKRSPSLDHVEIKLLMRYPGFYEHGIQDYCNNGALERPRAVFNEGLAFARLMQVVARLFSFRDGPMDRQALESSLGQISSACHGDGTCLKLMVEVMEATLQKKDKDFLPDGASDVHSESSAFTVAGLASCARRLRVACDTIRNQPVQLTFGRVVGAFLETPPKGWVPLFNSLETVLFFLRFVEREDLKLAYKQFEAENVEVFASDRSMQKLLAEAKEFYTEPFLNLQEDAKDLCNLDVRSKLCQKKLGKKSRRKSNSVESRFTNEDWNLVVDIAACAAESMKEKYNVPMLPHHTQMITLLMLAIQVCQGPGPVTLPRTILAKVGTGEGKSWIIGMLAAFVARKGLRAHVVIDNDTLLARDYATMSALFQKMQINADKGTLDKGHQVVYCSAVDIEMHFMAKMKEGAVDSSFRKCVMIVDEVDSLIVDEGVYQCYVDDHQEGSEVCEWWWHEGRDANKYDHEPWKQKIMKNLENGLSDMYSKQEDKHYVVDSSGMIWALDERTALLKRSAWYLWLELLRKSRIPDYRIRYMTRQNVICKKSCFASYSFIFGLTGSLGTAAEQVYTKKQFSASCFMVPPFLDTCQGTSRPRPRCVLTKIDNNGQKQLTSTVRVVQQHCSAVPILVVVRDQERVRKVAEALLSALPSHAVGDRLGPGVIELVDRPGKEAEFQQMVEVATQPLEAVSSTGTSSRCWRVTITTAIGARGQDYHISDELVDEKGGFLLVLEYVPDSEREWIQFLGRTARHDHPGQYAVILNSQDYIDVFGSRGAEEGNVVREILEHMNANNERRLSESEEQLEKGMLMHQCTQRFWSWVQKHRGDKRDSQEKFGQWVDLCDSFEGKRLDDIKDAFDELNLPQEDGAGREGTDTKWDLQRSFTLPSQEGAYVGDYLEGKRHGDGRCVFEDGRVYSGQWVSGRMHGAGRMNWPSGQSYEGQYRDDKRSGTGHIRWPDGRSYHGQWLKGTQHGHGTYTNQQGLACTCEWRDGRKVDKSSTPAATNATSEEESERPSDRPKGKNEVAI